MNKKFAGIFPGQGSQSLGMLADLASAHPQVVQTYAQASKQLDCDLWTLVQQGPEQQLHLTQYTQLAMLVAGVAAYRVWQQVGGDAPVLSAGHSLGEYTALVCAQVLEFTDAVRLVSARGRLMQEAVPEGQGGMAAIIGLQDAEVVEICQSAAQGDIIAPANFNTIGQIVIAGTTAAIDRALVLAEDKGARLAKRIPVSAPCHCALLKPAALEFAQYLEKTPFNQAIFPVISNVDVTIHQHPDDIRESLVRQLYSPVRWLESMQFMLAEGIEVMMEYGPGRVLTGLNKRIDRQLKTYPIYDNGTLQQAYDGLYP